MNKIPFVGVTICLMLGISIWCHQPVPPDAATSPLTIYLSFSLVFLMGGYFLKILLFPGLSVEPPEHLAVSFGLNVPLLVLAGIITTEGKGNVVSALSLLLIAQCVLWPFAAITL